MKRVLTVVLVLTMLGALAYGLFGCGRKDLVTYDPSKYTESINLDEDHYTLVYEDEFNGAELDRTVWGDCRQGTRRDGFWTKNLAYTDGEGHLIIRTEKRGSRWCSDTQTRQVTGYNGSTVKLTYDDCVPFGLVAGDFGDIGDIDAHTTDLVGYVIEDLFDDLGEYFDEYLDSFDLDSGDPVIGTEELEDYEDIFDLAAELFSYYAFVPEVKDVVSTMEESAIIGLDLSYTIRFGTSAPTDVDLRSVAAKLFGFSTQAEFVTCVENIADIYADYKEALEQGGEVDPALENGCFRSESGAFVFPVAIRNEASILLTYVIVGTDGHVSLWMNDVATALRMTNYSEEYYTGAEVTNETYCKNILFVTGPEGVYSGAIRTLDLYEPTYGYYEMRCKLPTVPGIWHAFWLMCGNVYSEENGSADGVEIDVFEYLPARDAVNCALHWDGYEDAHKNVHMRFKKTGFGDGEYHTFGMLWDETGYTFYMEGKKVWHTTGDGICPEKGHMLISTEYGEWGDWVADLDLDDLPVDWEIDYVRVYERK